MLGKSIKSSNMHNNFNIIYKKAKVLYSYNHDMKKESLYCGLLSIDHMSFALNIPCLLSKSCGNSQLNQLA